MSRSVVGIVFLTDLKNTLRDRRTWIAMVILPLVLIPVLLLVVPTAIERQGAKLDEAPPVVAVAGAEHAPGLVEFLQSTGLVRLEFDEGGRVGEGEVKAVLAIPPGAEAQIAAGGTAAITVEFDAADTISQAASSRLQLALDRYRQEVVAARLAASGVDPAILHPIEVRVTNVAPRERVGAFFLSLMMPMMLAIWSALGGMYAAIDAVAGEKERGTLEALLATPPDRTSLVLGKYLVVVVTSIVASAIALLAMFVAFWIKPEALLGDGEGLAFSLPALNAALILVVSALLAAFFSSLELAVSSFSRTFREAQSYLSPLSVAIVVPAIFTQFVAPHDAAPIVFYLPLINGLFVFKELILGQIDWAHFAITAVSSLLWVAFGLYMAVRLFRKESVLFRI